MITIVIPNLLLILSSNSRIDAVVCGYFNDSIDAYRTEDTILYGIHIGYPSNLKESAQAELKKILENGIGQN